MAAEATAGALALVYAAMSFRRRTSSGVSVRIGRRGFFLCGLIGVSLSGESESGAE